MKKRKNKTDKVKNQTETADRKGLGWDEQNQKVVETVCGDERVCHTPRSASET